MKFVVDTHYLWWYLEGEAPSLSRFFDEQMLAKQIIIPTIVLAELMYLLHKKKVDRSFEKILVFLETEERFDLCPLSPGIIREAAPMIDFEIHDALIVATALHLDVPLMTSDEDIVNSQIVKTIQP